MALLTAQFVAYFGAVSELLTRLGVRRRAKKISKLPVVKIAMPNQSETQYHCPTISPQPFGGQTSGVFSKATPLMNRVDPKTIRKNPEPRSMNRLFVLNDPHDSRGLWA